MTQHPPISQYPPISQHPHILVLNTQHMFERTEFAEHSLGLRLRAFFSITFPSQSLVSYTLKLGHLFSNVDARYWKVVACSGCETLSPPAIKPQGKGHVPLTIPEPPQISRPLERELRLSAKGPDELTCNSSTGTLMRFPAFLDKRRVWYLPSWERRKE